MNDDGSRRSRRRFLTGTAALGATALAGCVTTGLSVSAPNVGDSPVFDSFSVANGVVWADDAARVSATLTEAATTSEKVRELSAITASGSESWAGTVTGGQTSVTMHLPVGTDLTVHAFTSSADPVDAQPLRIEGDSFP
ncbi:hypothetical protein [Halomarina rubra]|uniref:Twin-arginine translocation signal domain-containing protein n=1 Tax=Halomarina rubra TaxID=2071873 RepID=A0ABD6AYC3_9EURY|nr:hypothetical protein [Halomarina rubra]